MMSLLLVPALVATSPAQLKPNQSPAAPAIVDGTWFNTPDGKPMTLASRKGKPTLMAFWTFGCSNCIANLPAYARLYKRFKPKGVELIAIHTPELENERNEDAVAAHVKKYKIDYPVVIDGAGQNWNRWEVQYWPTIYVVDAEGRIRYRWQGELAYKGATGEAQIAAMLNRFLADPKK